MISFGKFGRLGHINFSFYLLYYSISISFVFPSLLPSVRPSVRTRFKFALKSYSKFSLI